MFRSLFPQLFGPLLTTLTAAIGFVIKDWQQQRSRDRQQKEALAHSTARVTFIRAWLDAQSRVAEEQDLAGARKRAERDLEATYNALDSALESFQKASATRGLGVLRRIFLAYHLPSLAARRARRVFYVYLIILVALIPAGFYNDPTMSGWDEVYSMFLAYLIFAFPLFPIHVFATWKGGQSRAETVVEPGSRPGLGTASEGLSAT